jgi:hypothetical protein
VCQILTAYSEGPATLMGGVDFVRSKCTPAFGVFTDLRDAEASGLADAAGD